MNTLKERLAPWRAWMLPVIAGLAGGFALGAWFIGGEHEARPRQGELRPAAAEPARAQAYTCSMHPQVRSTDPHGKCPICGMDLIPVPEDDGDDERELPRLSVSPRAAALMQVEVWPVERRAVTVPVPLFGRIEADETRLRTVAAWAPGRLERLHVDATGTAVRAGQPMVDLYSPQLISAQEELLQALRAERELDDGIVRDATRLTVEAARDRLRLLGLSRAQIVRLETEGRVAERIAIPAPVGGVVLERLAAAGDYVATGQAIYRLADLASLWLQLEAYEKDLASLAVGRPVRFTTESLPGAQFEGVIAFIEPVVGTARTARVRVEVANPDGRLRPGMFARAVATVAPVDGEAAPLVIPASAPLVTGRRAVVYVQQPGGERPTFAAREVTLGARAGDWQVVTAGLEEGERVVSNGAFKIDAELQIRGRPSMMQPAAAQAPETFRAELGALVEAQFRLVRALAADDPDAARSAASAVDAALHAVDGGVLQSGAARAAWNRRAGTMHDSLAAVAAAANLDGMRTHFEAFSDALTEAVQDWGMETRGPVYRAMCPMVQGREGYWLQDEQQIANPYYGAAMLRCGAIVEELAPEPGHAADRGSEP